MVSTVIMAVLVSEPDKPLTKIKPFQKLSKIIACLENQNIGI